MRRRLVLAGASMAAAALAASVGGLARRNVRRERAKRAALGDRLYVEERGRGDPVVFLAGLQGSTRFWGHAFDALAADHRLIFVDALGFGRSPWPEVEYTLETHLSALRRTLVSAGAAARLTLVGHSLGAILAAFYAARHREEVSGVVLLGAPVFASPAEARRRIRDMSPLAALFVFNRPLAAAACTVMCAARPLLLRTLPGFRHDLPAAVVRDGVLHFWPAVDGTIRNVLLSQPVSSPVLRLGPLVTFVHGCRDAVTPLDGIRRLAAQSGARLVETTGGHLGYVTTDRLRTLSVIAAAARRRQGEG